MKKNEIAVGNKKFVETINANKETMIVGEIQMIKAQAALSCEYILIQLLSEPLGVQLFVRTPFCKSVNFIFYIR